MFCQPPVVWVINLSSPRRLLRCDGSPVMSRNDTASLFNGQTAGRQPLESAYGASVLGEVRASREAKCPGCLWRRERRHQSNDASTTPE
jgi:hypothetical protein